MCNSCSKRIGEPSEFDETYAWAKANLSSNSDEVINVMSEKKEETKDIYEFAKYDYIIAIIEMRRGQNRTALTRLSQSLELFKASGSDDINFYYGLTRNMAAVEYNLGNYKASTGAFKDAIKLTEKLDLKRKEVDYAKLNYAKALLEAEDYEKGNNLLIALYNPETKTDKVIRIASGIELGKNAREIGMYERSKEYFHSAVALDDKNSYYGDIELELAKTLHKEGKANEALIALEESYAKMTDNYGRFVVRLEEGKINLEEGDKEAAAENLLAAISFWDFASNMEYIAVYDYLAEATGNHAYSKQYRALRDERKKSLEESSRIENIRATEFQAESIRLIARKNYENNQMLKRVIIAVVCAVVFLLLFMYYFRQFKLERSRTRSIVNTAFDKIRAINEA
jgi:tetratricopeptide (TPR) repeat protein